MIDFDMADEAVKYAFPAFIIIMIIEFYMAKHLFDLKESLAGLTIAIVASFITAATKAATLGIFILVFELTKDLRMDLLGYESFGWGAGAWIAVILLDDMCFYWHHRFSHTIRILWAAHIPHHSAKKFNFTIGIRNGWFIPFYKPIWWIWIPLIGFEPVMMVSATVINAVFQFTLHTQLMPSWGWIGKIINNPYQHRAHHSCNVEYLDTNHGGIFLIWDHLFGTFVNVDDDIKLKYGVIHDPDTYNVVKIHTHEFQDIWRDVRSVSSWSDKLKYIFYPPGWSHDGSTKTTKQLRQEIKEAKLAA
jgi:sterol desaturase/sphingolipid hydroxylase (fatty acid hydroxylase superfamily)